MNLIRIKYIFWIVILLLSFWLFSWSFHYRKDPLFVGEAIFRSLALKAIKITVSIYDPSPQQSIARLSFSSSENLVKLEENGSRTQLQKILSSLIPSMPIYIIHFDNSPIVQSPFRFRYQSYFDKNLVNLREKHNLCNLAVSEGNDFINLVAITNWVSSLWEHGISGADVFDPVVFDADTVIERARTGGQFWCHPTAMTLIQVAAALGYQGRLVSLTDTGYQSDDMHAVAEIWSNYYQKWVVFDPDFNIWYTQNGIPLNTLEIHEAVMAEKTSLLKINFGVNRSSKDFEHRILSLYKYYRYFYIDLRNDWLSNSYFPGHPARSDYSTVFWQDNRNPPVLNLYQKTNNKNEIYWELNRTFLTFSPTEGNLTESIVVTMHTVTPNFSHYLVRLNSGPPERLDIDRFMWRLHPGLNSLEVKSVNSAGESGKVVSVSLRMGR